MSAAALLSAAIARIEEFLLEDGAPATCGNDFKEKVGTLVSELRQVKPLFEGRNNDVDFNKEVARLAYDTEDSVESEALLEQEGCMSSKGKIKRLMLNGCSRNKTSFLRIKKRIDELIKLYPTSVAAPEPSVGLEGDMSNMRSMLYPTPTVALAPEKLKTDREEYTFVGLEKELDTLTSKLITGRDGFKLAIVGMAGIGKTVLAVKFHNDPRVKCQFDVCAWACVTQESDVTSVVRSILSTLSFQEMVELPLEEEELKMHFHKTLSQRRCLIFLDDVWSPQVWETMRHFLPDDLTGSGLVITTRDEGVAHSFGGEVFNVRFWKDSETEELFKRELGLHHPDKKKVLADINKNAALRGTVNTIISMCQGLPLEIIRVAGILKQTDLEDWGKTVQRMLTNEMEETGLLKSIAVSYDYLPPHLKPCFLYLGRFPRGKRIQLEEVYFMWMAEGLASNEDKAKSYLKELVDRNLVREIGWEDTGETLECKLQDMTRKLCILKGKAEGWVGIMDSKHGSSTKCRSAIYLNGNIIGNDISSCVHVSKNSRALLFCRGDYSPLISRWSKNFVEIEKLECTKVLDFDGIDFRANKLSISTGKLVHLRYLGFQRCYFDEFVSSFFNFPYLETLDLRVTTKVIIPNVLWKLSNLKHLFFPAAYECKTKEKLKLSGARKLRVIENFRASICDVDDLLEFKHLQIFQVTSDGENNELEKLISNVHKMSESQSQIRLSLVLNDFDCYSSERQYTFGELLKCGGIQNLYLEGCIAKVPENLKMAQNFTHIFLHRTEFRKDPMPMLGEVENLKYLALMEDAIRVKEISCCNQSFPRLENLVLDHLQYLEVWVLESGSMPALTDLTITHCLNLVTLPDELKNIRALTDVVVVTMPRKFKEQVDNLVQGHLELWQKELDVAYFGDQL